MIVVDSREVGEHPDLVDELGKYNIDIAIDRLDAADYVFVAWGSKLTGIERAEVSNLVQKMKSGELEEQLTRCAEQFSSVILLVEGIDHTIGDNLATYKGTKDHKAFYRNYVFPHTTLVELKALESRLSQLGFEVLHATDFTCSMATIAAIYHNRTKPPEAHKLFMGIRKPTIPVKMSNNPSVPKLLALCDRMPEKVAIRLIYEYKTVWGVLNTPDKELLGVEGMGRGLLARLRKGVGMDADDN